MIKFDKTCPMWSKENNERNIRFVYESLIEFNKHRGLCDWFTENDIRKAMNIPKRNGSVERLYWTKDIYKDLGFSNPEGESGIVMDIHWFIIKKYTVNKGHKKLEAIWIGWKYCWVDSDFRKGFKWDKNGHIAWFLD